MKKIVFKILAIILIIGGIVLTSFGVVRYMTNEVAVNSVNEYSWDGSGDTQVGEIVIDEADDSDAIKTKNGSVETSTEVSTEKGVEDNE